jgi:hypothetical protein
MTIIVESTLFVGKILNDWFIRPGSLKLIQNEKPCRETDRAFDDKK